ncbi:MAG TPA: hypothetical protein VF323_13150 [Candidatus Limnocylindrales bacterium]
MPALPPPYRGPFCSELTRVVPTDEVSDCVASSGIDIANAATGGVVPTDAAEREALRVDSGDTVGGMTLEALQVGLRKRYGLNAVLISGRDAIEKALDDGFALVVFGIYSSLERKRRYQDKADFLHAMFFDRQDARFFFHADPLAGPKTNGSEMPREVFRTYAKSGGFKALGLREASARNQGGPNMGQTTVTTSPIHPAINVSYAAGTQRFTATGRASAMKSDGRAFVDADVTIEQADNRVPHGHGFLRLSSGGSAGFYVLRSAVTPVTTALPPGPDCAAATDPLNAQIERLQAQIAALQAPDDPAQP